MYYYRKMILNHLIVIVILALHPSEAKQDTFIKPDYHKVENDTNKIQTLQSLNDSQKTMESDKYFNKNINIKGIIQ